MQGKTARVPESPRGEGAVDDLLPEAFAAAREAARRVLGMRHFDVQLIGGMIAAFRQDRRNAHRRRQDARRDACRPTECAAAKGVHVVTVNEYLAQRDADWMGPVSRFLGLSVGVIKSGQTSEEKRAAYAADITYGTNNEFGFDYLRDNLAFRLEDRASAALRTRSSTKSTRS